MLVVEGMMVGIVVVMTMGVVCELWDRSSIEMQK
jgi:hypothetical protein